MVKTHKSKRHWMSHMVTLLGCHGQLKKYHAKSVIWIDNTCLILTITMFFWCLTKSLAELFADQKLFPQASTYQRRWLRRGTDCCPRPRREGGCWECLVVDLLLSTHPLLLSCILYFPSRLLLKKGNGEKVNQTFINLTEIVCMSCVSQESLKREKK